MKQKNGNQAEHAPVPAKKGKRACRILLRLFLTLAALAVIAAGAVYACSQYTKTHYEITFWQDTSRKVSQNLRIAVLSDLHNREYGEGNEKLIADIRSLKPDLILLPGDMVIQSQADYTPMLSLIRALSEIAPCYGVNGNHENERIYFYGDTELPKKFEEAGLTILRNRSEKIKIGADTIQLIGVEGTSEGFEKYGGRACMDAADIDPNAYCIVMAHIPILFDTQLSAYPFDLGIAGHTHGGLVILPRFGGLYSGEEGFFPTYYAGKYTLGNGARLIISRGLGDSRPVPRINNMPELIIIDVNWC